MVGSVLWVGYPRSYTAGRNRKPQYVVLHYTAGHEGPTDAENGAAYDKKRLDGTSTHYFTDSAGPALQEVPEGDRAHAARRHGNEVGIQIEICGTRQTRAQWLDAVSLPTLQTTAWLVADICKRNGFPVKLLTVAQTRAAYYAAEGQRPFGITDHSRVTQAYPEDSGDHMDLGTEFPWDVFLPMVNDEMEGDMPTAEEIAVAVAKYVYRDAARGFLNPNGYREAEIGQGTNAQVYKLTDQVTALKAQVDKILSLLLAGTTGGGATPAQVEEIVRDAVADLGEGGATQVRADA